MFKRLVFLSGFTGMLMILRAQDNPMMPVPGKPYPNPAVLLVENDKGAELISLASYKGIPLILDFFSSTCAVCFNALPKINQLQQDFNGRLRFLMIGKEDRMIRKNFNAFKKRFDLKLDIAYDSILHRDLGDLGYPLYVWIDSKGIVQAVTGIDGMNTDNIELFLTNKKVRIEEKMKRAPFDARRPLFINGNGGNDTTFLSRSMFTIYRKGQGSYGPPHIYYEKLKDSLQLMGFRLPELFNYAYFNESHWFPSSSLYGDVFPHPILEDGTYLTYKNCPTLYNYSLWLSRDQTIFTNIQTRFQSDLEAQFGYSASVEYRLMPYYSIKVRDGKGEKLRSKANRRKVDVSHGLLFLEKADVWTLIDLLTGKMQHEIPFIDETGISYPIDLKIEAVIGDFTSVSQALYDAGITITQSLRPMRVLILRKKPRNVAAN